MTALTRRGFLKQTAALAAVAAAGSAVAQPNERINVGLIGCRNRGHQDAGKFLDVGRFNLVTVCDCDDAMAVRGLDELKDKLPAIPKVEKDFRRVLDDKEIDAVIVATPDHWHAAMTLLALDAGKHVYLEKPATYGITEGKVLTDAAAKHPDLALLVGTQQRSAPHFADAKAFIQSGGLGKVGFCRAWIASERKPIEKLPDSQPPSTLDYSMWRGPAPDRPYNENRVHYNWRFIRDYGTGEMGNWGAHWIDTVLWLMNLGFPKAAAGHGGQFVVHDAKEWPDTQTVIYEYPDLTLLWEQRIWTKHGVNGLGGGAEFGGDKGSLVITRKGWTLYPKEGEPQEQPAGGDMEELHAVNFADCIAGTGKPAATMADGHKSATLCHIGNICVDVGDRLEFDGETQTFSNKEANKRLVREYRKPWRL